MSHDQFDICKEWPKDLDPLMHELHDILVECKALGEFNDTLKKALSYGTKELKELQVFSSSDYIRFLNSLLKWIPTENRSGTWVYTQLVVFYWIFNLKPFGENTRAQTPIVPASVGKPLKPVTAWLVKYAIKMGEFMSTKESWSEQSLQTFKNAKHYNVDLYEGPWTTFNEFFSRRLKVPHRVDGVGDDRVIVSPADCTYQSEMVPINEKSEINAKGMLWSIQELLSGSEYLAHYPFAEGKFVHAFLNTYDYHRQHAPISGKVREAKIIPGQCYLDVIKDDDSSGVPYLRPVRSIPIPINLTPDTLEGLVAEDGTGYQFLQCRGVIVIENDNLGRVAVLPIGMAQVSSVKTNLKIGQHVNKGDEISWFELGGSDVIMVFEPKANVRLTVDPKKGPHMLQGQQVIQAHY